MSSLSLLLTTVTNTSLKTMIATAVLFGLQVLFLLYYQVIFGYILTLALRFGLRFGLFQIVKKKKKKKGEGSKKKGEGEINENEIEEEWNIRSNFTSFFFRMQDSSQSSSSPPSSSSSSKSNSNSKSSLALPSILQCTYSRRGFGNNHDSNNHSNRHGHEVKYEYESKSKDDNNKETAREIIIIPPKTSTIIKASVSIPTCHIKTVGLSPFMHLQGNTTMRRRTYFLALFLEHLHFQFNIVLQIDEEEEEECEGEYKEEQKGGGGGGGEDGTAATTSTTATTTTTTTTNLEININLTLKMIRLYLFSQGLIAVLFRRLFRFHGSNTNANASANASASRNTNGDGDGDNQMNAANSFDDNNNDGDSNNNNDNYGDGHGHGHGNSNDTKKNNAPTTESQTKTQTQTNMQTKKRKKRKLPLYMITKILGGIEIVGIRASLAIKASKGTSKGNSTSTTYDNSTIKSKGQSKSKSKSKINSSSKKSDISSSSVSSSTIRDGCDYGYAYDYDYRTTLNVNDIFIKLENKNVKNGSAGASGNKSASGSASTYSANSTTTTSSTSSSNDKRLFCLSVDVQTLKLNIINNNMNNISSNTNCIGQMNPIDRCTTKSSSSSSPPLSSSIALEQLSFSLNYSSDTTCLQAQINSYSPSHLRSNSKSNSRSKSNGNMTGNINRTGNDSIQISTSTTEILSVMKLFFQSLQPIQHIMNTPTNTTCTCTRRNEDKVVTNKIAKYDVLGGGTSNGKKTSSIILEKFTIGTAINLIFVDDRVGSTSMSTSTSVSKSASITNDEVSNQQTNIIDFGRQFHLGFNVSLELGEKVNEHENENVHDGDYVHGRGYEHEHEHEHEIPPCSTGKELSVVVEKFVLKHCGKQLQQKGDGRSNNRSSNKSSDRSSRSSNRSKKSVAANTNINTFLFEMKKASLLVEENLQQNCNNSHHQHHHGKEFFVDLGSIAMNCDNPQESEYIIDLVLFFEQSMKTILPKKRKDKKKNTGKKNANESPFQCLAISCETLDLGIAVRCRENPQEAGGLRAKVDAHKLLLSLTPPNTIQNGDGYNTKTNNGEAIIELATLVTSFSFVPHQTFPTFVQCVNQVTKSNRLKDEKDSLQQHQKRIKYIFSGTNFDFYALLPSNNNKNSSNNNNNNKSDGRIYENNSQEEQSYFKISVSDIALREQTKLLSPHCKIQTINVLRATESVHFALRKSLSTHINNNLTHPSIVQTMEIQTKGGTLVLQWSPIIQWFITSAVKKILMVVDYYQDMIKKGRKEIMPNNNNKKKGKIPTNIRIRSNDTSIKVTAVLGGSSICNVFTKDLSVKVYEEIDNTWDKPNVTCDVGVTSLYLNNHDYEVAKLSSFRFSDTMRRASPEEISKYCDKKKDGKAVNFDEIVTGTCGKPLVEKFELTFGAFTRVDLPPSLHLGKVIEDITLTEKVVKEGLFASGILQRKTPPKRKYQLMNIHFNLPMLDANFLENKESNTKMFPGIKFGHESHTSMLNRWRFHIENLSVLIKRNTPPEITQEQLRDLDEDKSRRYSYGPMIQGGYFTLNISHVNCVLHPLNTVTPLGDIKNLKLVGIIYLTAVSPETRGLMVDKQTLCVPVKCPHVTEPPSTSSDCSYDFGVVLEAGLVPVKIYYDLHLSSDELHSNYGPILNGSIPGLMSIIQRFIPTPPHIDERYENPRNTTPPLSPWDNMRHQFHGRFNWAMEKISFRWLLDNVTHYDWSILLTTKNLHLHHSVSIFELKLSDAIVSIPHPSYHLLQFEKRRNVPLLLQERIKGVGGGGKFSRHSLLLLPSLKVHFGFTWQVPFPEVNESSRHHIPYLINADSWPQSLCPEDRFKYFRSEGVKMRLDIELSHDSHFSNWVALRGDVLPWLTHKCSSLPQGKKLEQENADSPDHDLKINGIEVDVSAAELCIGAWFDERADFISDDNRATDDILEGIYITIPHVRYILDESGKNRIDLNGVQAALLDIDCNEFICSGGRESYNQHYIPTQWIDMYSPRDWEESNDVNSYRIFQSLHNSSTQINSLKHILTIDHVNILDKSLDEIKTSMNSSLSSLYVKNLQKDKAPWTVLVAEMKLLWTLEIRDRVLRIVKDILFAINFMKVNARGTPQQLLVEKGDTGSSSNVSDDGSLESLDLSSSSGSSTGSNLPSLPGASEDTASERSFDTSDFHHTKESSIGMSANTPKPKSHLDYLLNPESEENDLDKILTDEEINEIDDPKSNAIISPKIDRSTPRSISNPLHEEDGEETIPTFDLHLSNPQIQFHSEKTGGSVIISMQGAYIEMKMYSHLFAKEEDFDAEDFRVETLLRRSTFLYTLDKMELYSLSNIVDMDVGLQWLGTRRMNDFETKKSESLSSRKQMLEQFQINNVDARSPPSTFENLSNDSYEASIADRDTNSFPPDLQQHETKAFILPPLCKRIMDPCTFKTLQTCHRPPIDLTKEELAETIKTEDLISSLATTDTSDRKSNRPIDHIELFIDELSFDLDSHQFSTTLDVIRNVLLEPMQPDRERYYKGNKQDEQEGKDENASVRKIDGEKSEASVKMEEAIRQWDQQAYQTSKKGREYLRELANNLLGEVDEKQGGAEPSIRRIDYTLYKLKWKIASPDAINDSAVSFTGFKGVHDFTADGSVNSQITLEDIYIESKKPGPESLVFHDPSIIIKTHVKVERSPCCRCNKKFDRTTNETNSCRFHPGTFKTLPGKTERCWSCCKSMWKHAPGCIGRPHTGQERAVDIRMDALPRTVEGLTMYKHIEANMYPGVPHTVIVQLTKSLAKSFSNYFLGDGNKDELVSGSMHDTDTNSECSVPKLRRRTTSETSCEAFEAASISEMNGSVASSGSNLKVAKSNESTGVDRGRKNLLFGRMQNRRRKDSASSKKKKKENNLNTKGGGGGGGGGVTDHYSVQSVDGSVESNSRRGKTREAKDGKDGGKEGKKETIKKYGEIVFIKYWRVGGINIDVSIAGFGRFVDLSNHGVNVPFFQKAYKIGTSEHIYRKLVKHFVTSLVSNGLEIIRKKIGGGHKSNPQKYTHIQLQPASSTGALGGLSEGDESDGDEEEQEHGRARMLLPQPPKSRKKKAKKTTPVGLRKRLYTK